MSNPDPTKFIQLSFLRGDPGPQGPRGPRGFPGSVGIPGPKGTDANQWHLRKPGTGFGSIGDLTLDPDSGQIYKKITDDSWELQTALKPPVHWDDLKGRPLLYDQAGVDGLLAAKVDNNAFEARVGSLERIDLPGLRVDLDNKASTQALTDLSTVVTSKADQSQLTSINSRVDAAELALGAKADKTITDGLNSRLDTVEGTLPDFAIAADVYSKAAADAAFKPIGYVPAWGELTNRPSSLADFGLNAEVADLLTAKADTANVYTKTEANAAFKASNYVPTYGEITGKPTSFPTDIANVSGLQASLDGKLSTGYVPSWASISGKPTSLAGFGLKTEADGLYKAASWKPTAVDLPAISELTGTINADVQLPQNSIGETQLKSSTLRLRHMSPMLTSAVGSNPPNGNFSDYTEEGPTGWTFTDEFNQPFSSSMAMDAAVVCQGTASLRWNSRTSGGNRKLISSRFPVQRNTSGKMRIIFSVKTDGLTNAGDFMIKLHQHSATADDIQVVSGLYLASDFFSDKFRIYTAEDLILAENATELQVEFDDCGQLTSGTIWIGFVTAIPFVMETAEDVRSEVSDPTEVSSGLVGPWPQTLYGEKTFPDGIVTPSAIVNGSLAATSQSATEVPVTVKGATGQTANLQEWRDANGLLIARMQSEGTMVFTSDGANSPNRMIPATGTGKNRVFDFYSNADNTNSPYLAMGVQPASGWYTGFSGAFIISGRRGSPAALDLFIGAVPNFGASLTADKGIMCKTDGKIGIGVAAPAEKLEVAGNIKATGTASNLAQPSWSALSLSNSWVNFGTPYANAGYRLDSMGYVHLRGVIKGGTVTPGTQIALLPVGYRPPYQCVFAAAGYNGTSGVHAEIQIASTGAVTVNNVSGLSNTYLSLDGITFSIT